MVRPFRNTSSRTPATSARWLLAAAALLLLAGCVVGSPSGSGQAGAEPRRLSGQVTDDVGALDSRRGQVDEALNRLFNDTGIQLFVVFVRTFDGMHARDWAVQTATASGLGDRDILLAVATGDRAYAYIPDVNLPITDDQLAEVDRVAIEPALRQNDWAGAVIGAADGYRAVLAGQPVTTPQIEPGNPDPERGGGTSGTAGRVLLVLVLLAFVAGGIALLLYLRRRRTERSARLAADPNDAFPGVSTEQLSTRANTLLLQVDDALRTSERELGIARGEYGEEATELFSTTVAEAKAEVAEAFRLRMELEDLPDPAAPPSKERRTYADEPGTRRRLAEIIRHGEAADAKLDEQAEAFRELRGLESTLEQTVPALSSRRAQLAARLPEVSAELERLQAEFTGSTLAAVAENGEEAATRLRFATAALAQAGQDAASGRRPKAALQVRAADQALDQTEELLDAVGKAAADLRAAKETISTLLAEVSTEIESARSAQPTSPELWTAVAAGEEAIKVVRAAQAEPTMDPLAELRRLREADAALDKALEAHRDAKQRAERAAAQLPAALAAARAEISAASDFINTRRGAVGTRARTLLAEAQRLLTDAQAHAQTDPVTALDEVRRADQTAEQAVRAAQADVETWPGPGGFGGGRNAAADGMLGAILGGILVGGGRGGWGGGWRSPGGFAGGGLGGHRPGGFGGSRGGGGGFRGGGFGGGRGGGGRGGFGGGRGGGGRF